MRRREVIAGICGAAVWPLIARAQQRQRIRQVGYLTAVTNDRVGQVRFAALRRGLEERGWINSSNVVIHVRWGGGNPQILRSHAAELVELKPDVLVVETATALVAVREATSVLPIVFVSVSDPVGNGFVSNLARPTGNITGFSLFEYEMVGKWLEILMEMVPATRQVTLLQNGNNPNWAKWLTSAELIANAIGLKLGKAGVVDRSEIDRVMMAIAGDRNGAIIALPDPFLTVHLNSIIGAAALLRLPIAYPFRYWVEAGGLISYGIDQVDLNHRAASYVDRILKGESPADLPVQRPTRFQLVVNMKTAKALGIEVPATVLVRADEVIE